MTIALCCCQALPALKPTHFLARPLWNAITAAREEEGGRRGDNSSSQRALEYMAVMRIMRVCPTCPPHSPHAPCTVSVWSIGVG
eukprot:566777-Hanusia_phi.AAC.1